MAATAAAAALLLAALVAAVSAHTYHIGSCPRVPPMDGFTMNKFMGKWHVLEKTSTRVRCLTNEYLRPGEQEGSRERLRAVSKPTSEWEDVDVGNGGSAPGGREWRLLQRMQLPLPAINNGVRYNAKITLVDASQPAAMTVKFPLNIMGSSSYVVFDTDYDTYAGVYSCQNIAFWHRHSASIMSRTASLDSSIINKLRNKLSSYGIAVRDMDRIRQTCPDGQDDGIQVHIKPNVFRTNATDILQDANDVVASAADAAKRAVDVYNTVNTVYNAVQGARKRRDSLHGDVDAQVQTEESDPEILKMNEMNLERSTDINNDESTARLPAEAPISEALENGQIYQELSADTGIQESFPTEGSNVNKGYEVDVIVEENSTVQENLDESKTQIMAVGDVDGIDGFKKLGSDGEDSIPVPEEAEIERDLKNDTYVNERTLTNILADLTVDWMP